MHTALLSPSCNSTTGNDDADEYTMGWFQLHHPIWNNATKLQDNNKAQRIGAGGSEGGKSRSRETLREGGDVFHLYKGSSKKT